MIGGIARQAEGVEVELRRRLPAQRKTQRGKLALLVARTIVTLLGLCGFRTAGHAQAQIGWR